MMILQHFEIFHKLGEMSFVDLWDMVFTRFSGRTDWQTHPRTDATKKQSASGGGGIIIINFLPDVVA